MMPRLPVLTVRLLGVVLTLAALTACGRSGPEPTVAPPPVATAALDVVTTDAVTTIPAAAPVASPTPLDPEKTVTTASGLQYTEVVAGSGPQPQPGDVVTVHYTGKLQDNTIFDSSFERNEPIRFPLGQGMVIPGWDEGIGLMHEGGQAILVIPPDLAYGERGAGGGVIPPNATLIFDVQLVSVDPGAPAAPTVARQSRLYDHRPGLDLRRYRRGRRPQPHERPVGGRPLHGLVAGWRQVRQLVGSGRTFQL